MISNLTSINPAVTIARYAYGKLDKTTFILYIIAEILGGLFGFFIFNYIIKKFLYSEET
jgi:glycerol uptake facilitator-like aquaporin